MLDDSSTNNPEVNRFEAPPQAPASVPVEREIDDPYEDIGTGRIDPTDTELIKRYTATQPRPRPLTRAQKAWIMRAAEESQTVRPEDVRFDPRPEDKEIATRGLAGGRSALHKTVEDIHDQV